MMDIQNNSQTTALNNKSWHKSTQNKLTSFVDNYLINYPQIGVRNSTKKLLCSLYKKGHSQQKLRMISLMNERMNQLAKMGKASDQFLSLIKYILEFKDQKNQNPGAIYTNQKKAIINSLIKITDQVFTNLTRNQEYDFYSFCANSVDFDGASFKPYLIQANGCTRCFGRAENDFQLYRIDGVLDQYKMHLAKAEFKLKRTYQIKNLKINLNKTGKLNFRQASIFYLDETGEKKLVGRFQKNDSIPLQSFTTSVIYIQFRTQAQQQYARRRRQTVPICWICGKQDDQSCYSCRRGIDIQGQFKVVSANSAKLSSQLSESYKRLMELRKFIQDYYHSWKNRKAGVSVKNISIGQMQVVYTKIMQNLGILSQTRKKMSSSSYSSMDNSKKVINQQKMTHQYQEITNCFSCAYFEASNIVNFLKSLFTSKIIEFSKEDLSLIMEKVMNYRNTNKIESLRLYLDKIIAALYLLNTSIDIEKQFSIEGLTHKQKQQKIDIIFDMVRMFRQEAQNQKQKEKQKQKQKEKANTNNNNKIQPSYTEPIIKNQNIEKLKTLVVKPNFVNNLSITQRVKLFNVFMIPGDFLNLLQQTNISLSSLTEQNRLLSQQIEQFKSLINFNLEQIYSFELLPIFKILFKIIPSSLVPYSNLSIKNPEFLDYIHIRVPKIQYDNVYKNVVFSPNPIIALNSFSILPHLVKKLKLQDSMTLIKEICKFRDIWNLSLEETLMNFNVNLSQVQKDKQLLFSLQAYEVCEDPSLFQKTYQLLVPQRMKFLIRLQVPQQFARQQRNYRDGGFQYPIFATKQVKSQDLQNSTMDAIRMFVAAQLIQINVQMTFDLIVQGNIIDDLSLPIEVVYKKLVTRQAKKTIGKTTYYLMKVVYGMQGIYDANQRGANITGDQKLDECINCSAYLMQRIPGSEHKIGLDLLMNIISKLKSDDHKKRQMLFNILKTVFMNPNITRKLVQEHYGDLLINQTMKFLNFSTKKDLQRSQLLLEVCSKTIDSANKQLVNLRKKSTNMRKMSEMVDQNEKILETENAVQDILKKIKQVEVSYKKHTMVIQKMIKLLPFCSKDQISASKIILDYFQVDKFVEGKFISKTMEMCTFFDALEEDYMSIKTLCKQNGLAKYVLQKVHSTKTNGAVDVQKTIINSENLQPNFTILKGLLKGNQMLQAEVFDQNLLPVIDHLSKHKIGKSKITTICYQMIQYFKRGKMVDPRVKSFFVSMEQAMKQKGSTNKNDIFQKMKAKRQAAKKKLLADTEQYQQGDIHCSKCKLGYGSSKDIMGLYIYGTQVDSLALDNWWKQSKKMFNISNISYFSIIHFECHRQAFDQDRKNMKSEWQGAVVRNSQAKCNNWIPFKGPKTTDEQFDKVQAKYFERNKNGNFWNVVNDLNGLIYRFSIQYDFGKQGHGSSYSHNCQLIPVIFSFACHSMKRLPDDIKFLREGIRYFDDHKFKKPNVFRLYLTVNLMVEPYQTFLKRKQRIWQGIQQIFGDKQQNFNQKKADLIFLLMISQIYEILHKKVENQSGDVHLVLDKHIPNHFNSIIKQFEELSQNYRNQFLKYEKIQDFKKKFGL